MQDPSPADGDKLVKPDSVAAKALGIVGGVVGVVFGKYCGVTLFVPAVAGGLSAWVLSKTLSAERKPLLAAAAVQIGHIAWMLIGFLLAANVGPAMDSDLQVIGGIEIVLYSLAVAWLLASPSWFPAGILILYQVVVLGMNIATIQDFARDSIEHKAVVTTIGLRIFAIGCLITGMRAVSRSRRDEEAETESGMTWPT